LKNIKTWPFFPCLHFETSDLGGKKARKQLMTSSDIGQQQLKEKRYEIVFVLLGNFIFVNFFFLFDTLFGD
jgi:hypothetical protein